ncbi:MAG TPA: hypothetical protein VJ983_11185, partial [candidate division Zixibacteria bacterium]|nr:hypothetical protein [candidate division Zixibacteria bacterium]
MRSIVMLVIAGILSLQLLVPAQTAARPVYKAYKVEFPTYAHPRKLNNLRQVMITPPSNQAPLVWFNGTLTSLPGFDTTGYTTYYATGINDSGYLCAYGTYTDFSGSITDPFFWTGAAVKLNENPIGITNPPSPDPYGYVFDVNNRNDIVGQLPADSGWARAVIWFGGNGQAVVIGTLDQYQESWGRAVNESGQVACDADQPVPAGIASNRAFIWDNGAKTTLEPLDGNAINNTWALDINSSGWVVGRSALYDSTHSEIRATLWRNGTPVDLIGGPITNGQTVATAINDSGMIILSSNGYNGRLWYNDSLWLLDSLVENTQYGDGTPVPSVDAPLDINEHGDIITGEGSLLVLQTPGLIVNSEGDADDNDLSDGVCYTGGVNSLGEDECTLRAAIEQANFNAGRDTIKFNIPTTTVPRIAPTSSLPPITGSVNIDARTQPVFKKVEVDGSSAPAFSRSGEAAVDGLAVTTDSVEIRGMIIDGFSGNGLNLQSGVGHIIELNTFGGDSTKPNQLNGILISGADSVAIGDDYAQANT